MDFQKFTEEECCKCGIIFGVSSGFQRNRREDKSNFFCPNGHSQAYLKSMSEQLRETLEMKNRQLEQKDMELSRLARALKKLAKPKKSK